MGWFQRAVIWSWLLLCLGGMMLTGCHTVRGAGEDIEGAGRSIERATR
ncbi:MAG: entericidin A/B family lipoprotein [Planctomycetes bacterium]|nr:entericidin A/B family lipoprotein [Planctomycetota bacterium]